ncbi:hypothetical protein WJX72_006572 [[Myrmecia] bisecta]|uniref:Uncharacterized protein n=1 Tax=[Myrmecia] bisecta TaxID=41462 RepID=A0AAW1PT04_9CHLO
MPVPSAGSRSYARACSDARLFLLVIVTMGEVLQGGLIFGWNGLALMIKAQDNFDDGCPAPVTVKGRVETCKSQETKLALIFVLGAFAVNFGPLIVGPILDRIGPRIMSAVGTAINALGLILFGISHSNGANAFEAAAIFVGLGGLAYHLGLFSICSLFPRHRGLVSACLCGGFVGSGMIFQILKVVATGLGNTRRVYVTILLVYSAVVTLWIPLSLWLLPMTAMKVGQRYVRTSTWRFALVSYDCDDQAALKQPAKSPHAHASPPHEPCQNLEPARQQPLHQLRAAKLASTDPPNAPTMPRRTFADLELGEEGSLKQVPVANLAAARRPEGQQGMVLRESQRFAQLKNKTFWQQICTPEAIGMTLIFTINVFCLQYYLGSARLQLEQKHDDRLTYTNLVSIIVACGAAFIPLTGYLLDRLGFGITLAIINAAGVLTSLLEAVPNLPLQALTFALWCFTRFIMYATFYTVCGSCFGYKNFGKIIGVTNAANGLAGLLAIPLNSFAIDMLHSRYWILNISQAIILLPLFGFCYKMWVWERRDVIDYQITPVSETN